MKSLSESLFDSKTQTMESLFDKDLVSKKLPIEKFMRDFSSDALQKLSVDERNELFDQLFEMGRCEIEQLIKSPIDLSKSVLIIKRDMLKIPNDYEYPCKFVFVFEANGETHHAALMDSFGVSKYGVSKYRVSKYRWWPSSFKEWIASPSWKGKIYKANRVYGGCSFSVVSNEEISKNIIKGITKK